MCGYALGERFQLKHVKRALARTFSLDIVIYRFIEMINAATA